MNMMATQLRHPAPRGAPRTRGLPRAACRGGAALRRQRDPRGRAAPVPATRTSPPSAPCSWSGIGCSSRLPHYMKTLRLPRHPRRTPSRSPRASRWRGRDLAVFVNTGRRRLLLDRSRALDNPAIRYNMNLTVIRTTTTCTASPRSRPRPTSPIGLKTNTTPARVVPRGAQPPHRHAGRAERLVRRAGRGLGAGAALRHRLGGLPAPAASRFVRIVSAAPSSCPRRSTRGCTTRPHADPHATRTACQLSPSSAKTYKHQQEHDPSNIDRAREIASCDEPIPVGILYRNPECRATRTCATPARCARPDYIKAGLEKELDKFTVWPDEARRRKARLTTGVTA